VTGVQTCALPIFVVKSFSSKLKQVDPSGCFSLAGSSWKSLKSASFTTKRNRLFLSNKKRVESTQIYGCFYLVLSRFLIKNRGAYCDRPPRCSLFIVQECVYPVCSFVFLCYYWYTYSCMI